MKLNKAATIITILIGIPIIVSTIIAFENHWASAEDMKNVQQSIVQINKRLDQKILEDRLSNIQNRIWILEDRYKNTDMPVEIKKIYRSLVTEKDKLIKRLEILIKAKE